MVFDAFSSVEDFCEATQHNPDLDETLLQEVADYDINPIISHDGRKMLYADRLKECPATDILSLLEQARQNKR